jgi:LacI family transcriptional regulator
MTADSKIKAKSGSSRRTKRKSTPTMVQVAKAAGVSIFTVSAVVNGTSTVSEALRTRTQRAIDTIGYKRNDVARSLKTGKTRTVGISVGDITNPFYTDVVSIIQRELQKAGYAVMLCCSDSDVALQQEQVALMRDRMVDGLIISPTGDDDNQLRRVVAETDIPVVLIDRILAGVDCDVVLLDNKAAVREAVGYLAGLGHRRIGFISGMRDSYPGRERLAGYFAALADAGIARDKRLVGVGNFDVDGAESEAMRLLKSAHPPTAIFASNNQAVIGVMRALRDLGMECPDDVSLVGLDDFPWADSFHPRLTTVVQPLREIGEEAARLLLERMAGGKERPGRLMMLDGRLVLRESSRPINH